MIPSLINLNEILKMSMNMFIDIFEGEKAAPQSTILTLCFITENVIWSHKFWIRKCDLKGSICCTECPSNEWFWFMNSLIDVYKNLWGCTNDAKAKPNYMVYLFICISGSNFNKLSLAVGSIPLSVKSRIRMKQFIEKKKKIPNEANLLTSICSSRGQKIQRIERVAFWINSV